MKTASNALQPSRNCAIIGHIFSLNEGTDLAHRAYRPNVWKESEIALETNEIIQPVTSRCSD